jgi:TrmH family RNA methyltransferase
MLPPITSLQNARVKHALKLRDRKGRVEQGRIIIDGVREIARAQAGGVSFDELFVCEEHCRSSDAQQLLARLPGERIQPVTAAVFEKLTFGERQEGIIATALTPQRKLSEVTLAAAPLVAVLEGVEKPGNVGAVLRSADAAGLSALIVADGGTDLYNPNAIRASLGAIFTVPVCVATSAETLAWLRGRKLAIYAARVDGKQWYHQADFRGPAAIVLGSEADGLSAAWQREEVIPIKLPMLGVVDSLNVSVTAGILFYEARRQRSQCNVVLATGE